MCPNSTTTTFLCSRHTKESVDNLWLSLRPVCELQGKVTESELRQKGKPTGKGGISL